MEEQQIRSIFILGGSGKAGVTLAQEAIRRGYSVTGTCRSEETKKKIEAIDNYKAVIVPDIETTNEDYWLNLFQGYDVVVYMMNPGHNKHPGLYGASLATVDAAEKANVKWYVMMSVMDTFHTDYNVIPEHYSAHDKYVLPKWRIYFKVNREARYKLDAHLAQRPSESKMAWTILRCSPLSQNPAVGTVAVDTGVGFTKMVSRADIADLILQLLKKPEMSGVAFDVGPGKIPINEAIDQVCKSRGVDFIYRG